MGAAVRRRPDEESMKELLYKRCRHESEMEKKGLHVNMGKTKILVSGINLDVLKKSGGVCQTVGGNAMLCSGCKR